MKGITVNGAFPLVEAAIIARASLQQVPVQLIEPHQQDASTWWSA